MAREYGKTIVIVNHNQNIVRMADGLWGELKTAEYSPVEQNEPIMADDIDQ